MTVNAAAYAVGKVLQRLSTYFVFKHIKVLKVPNACVILTSLEIFRNVFWTPPNGLWL